MRCMGWGVDVSTSFGSVPTVGVGVRRGGWCGEACASEFDIARVVWLSLAGEGLQVGGGRVGVLKRAGVAAVVGGGMQGDGDGCKKIASAYDCYRGSPMMSWTGVSEAPGRLYGAV